MQGTQRAAMERSSLSSVPGICAQGTMGSRLLFWFLAMGYGKQALEKRHMTINLSTGGRWLQARKEKWLLEEGGNLDA